jgi:cytochrome P450
MTTHPARHITTPDFADQGFLADPYPTYDRLRELSPVHEVTLPGGMPTWYITRYDDAREALADLRLSKETIRIGHQNKYPFGDVPMHEHLLQADPPGHTRLRKLVSKAFTPRRVEQMRPRIKQMTGGLLDTLAGRHRVDLIEEFAFPLPFMLICALLGISEGQQAEFRRLAIDLMSSPPGTTPEQIREQAVAFEQFLRTLIAEKRASPGDDLTSALVAVRDADEGRLTETELVSMEFLLLLAGYETTVNLIGNGMYALLRHPGQMAALRADPALLEPAIDELLRYESPLANATLRRASEPVCYSGVTIPAGGVVLIGLCAADRDGSRFSRPDELDLNRRDVAHLAFGHGVHYCLGAQLARMQGQIAIGELLRRYSSIELAIDPAELRWRPGALIRGLRELPVLLQAA